MACAVLREVKSSEYTVLCRSTVGSGGSQRHVPAMVMVTVDLVSGRKGGVSERTGSMVQGGAACTKATRQARLAQASLGFILQARRARGSLNR